MSQEFYLVKIGDIALTEDGTDSGNACLTTVEGLSGLFLAHHGSTVKALSGMPRNFIFENEGKGVNLITKPFVVKTATLNALKTLIDTANADDSVIPVQISDGPGAQNMDCKPLFEGGVPPIQYGSNFYDTDLYDVEIRLVTVGYTV